MRFTLGSRSSLEPAWQLIKGCGWSLTHVIHGLESLNFNTNVRDNAAFKLPSDLSVRKSFAREPRLQPFISHEITTAITPLQLANHIRNEQFDQLIPLSKQAVPSLHSLIISLSTESTRWQLFCQQDRVSATLDKQPLFQLKLIDAPAKRFLASNDIRI